MPRIPRRRLGRGVFHVWNRAHDRRYVFDTKNVRNRYRDYLLTDRERADDEELFRADRPVIGDENFLAQAVTTIGRFISRRVGRPRKS